MKKLLTSIVLVIAIGGVAFAVYRWFFARGSQRETMVALAFGLVHGLAFSQALNSLRLEPFQKALSIFGFNVGIEIMQLAIMIAAFPLLRLSKRENYHTLRVVAASLALVVSSVWIVERIARI